jgi:hypothetical protein
VEKGLLYTWSVHEGKPLSLLPQRSSTSSLHLTLAVSIGMLCAMEASRSLSFLNDAAHVLAATAPETSAYLMSRRNQHALANGMDQTDISRQHVCNCCGHIMALGIDSTLKLDSYKTHQKRPRRRLCPGAKKPLATPTTARSGPAKVITCGMCSRKTVVRFPPPERIARKRSRKEPIPSSTGLQRTQTGQRQELTKLSTTATASTGSKKRAKNRKGGLQALLEQNKAAKSSTGFGLTLEHFQKK